MNRPYWIYYLFIPEGEYSVADLGCRIDKRAAGIVYRAMD